MKARKSIPQRSFLIMFAILAGSHTAVGAEPVSHDVQSTLAKAEQLSLNNRFDEAAEEFKKAKAYAEEQLKPATSKLEDQSQNAQQLLQVLAKLSRFDYQQHRYAELTPICREIIEVKKLALNATSAEVVDDYVYMGDIYYALHDPSKAAQSYNEALNGLLGTPSQKMIELVEKIIRCETDLNNTPEVDNKKRQLAEVKSALTGAAESKPNKSASKPQSNSQSTTMPPGKSASLGKEQTQSTAPKSQAPAASNKTEMAAEKALKQHQLDEAEQLFRTAIDECDKQQRADSSSLVKESSVDDWHASLLHQAKLWKKLAEVHYQQKRMESVQTDYAQLVRLKHAGAAPTADRIADYHYLVGICLFNHDYKAAEHYLKIAKDNGAYIDKTDPVNLKTTSLYAKFLRSQNRGSEADALEKSLTETHL